LHEQVGKVSQEQGAVLHEQVGKVSQEQGATGVVLQSASTIAPTITPTTWAI